MAGLLKKVSEATGGSADKMKILFGDIGGFVAVASLAGPQAATFAQNLIDMADRAGKSGAAFEIMKLSIENSSKIIGSSFDYLLRQVGTPLLDEFGGIANAIAGIFTALGVSVKEGGLKDLVSYIDSLFDDLQKTIETVAKNLPAALAQADFSGFKGGIDAVVNALKSMFGAIDITSVEGLKSAIELAGTAFLGLSKYTAGVIEVFEPLFAALVDVGKGAKDVDLSFLQIAGNIGGVVSALNLVLPLFTGLLAVLTAKQTLGLVTDIAKIGPALAAASLGIAPLVAGPVSVAALGAAFALAGYNLGTGLNPHIDAFVSKMAGHKTTLGGWIYDLVNGAEEAEKLGLSAGGAASGVGKIDEASGKAAKSTQLLSEEFRKSEIEAQNSAAAVDESNKSLDAAIIVSEKAKRSNKDLATAQKETNSYILQSVPVYDKLTGAITGYEQQLVKTEGGTVKLASAADKAGGGLAKIAEETKKAEESTRRWNEEIAKMAFEEKLAMIESQTKITTAQIEADSKISVAAIESIGNTINSTGELLQTLFGSVKDFAGMDWSSIRLIEKQIDMENKIRKEAHDKSMAWMDVEIEKMKAQTAALLKGEGLIKIDGAGLKPHLEAFMWEILRAIQVKVNKDGLKMLLGA